MTGIYVVATGEVGQRAIVIAADTGRAVDLAALTLDAPDTSGWEVGRLGNYDPGISGSAMVNRDGAVLAVNPPSVYAAPLVLVDITGGAEQATYFYPGAGDPTVHVRDFDDDWMDEDRLRELVEGATEFASLIRQRSTHPDDLAAADRYEEQAAEWPRRFHGNDEADAAANRAMGRVAITLDPAR